MTEKQAPLFIQWYTVLMIVWGLLFLILITANMRDFYHPLLDILVLGYTVATIANCAFGVPTVLWMFAEMRREYAFKVEPIHIPVKIEALELTEWIQSRGSTSGYVYILKDIDVTGYYKIGMTRHPYTRMKEFGVKLPFRTELIQVIETDNPEVLERSLHYKYRKQRIRGEWFKLTPKNIAYIKSL